MRVTKIRADFSYTVNIGNYESVKTSAGMEAEITNVEDPKQKILELQDMVRDILITEVENIKCQT